MSPASAGFFFWINDMKHIPHLKDLSSAEIKTILEKAHAIKKSPGDYRDSLAFHSLAMIFQKTSTRTRVSFEVAMTELGGHALYVDWDTSNFVLSGIDYETEYLSRNVSCIMARLLHHSDLETIISASQAPVINGCCEKFHPCQALTDVMTIQEHTEKPLDEITLMYVGVQNNVSNSLSIISDKLGIQLILATPKQDDNGESLDADVQSLIASSPCITWVENPKDAIEKADFVYTDTWIDMQYFNNPANQEENADRLKKMMPYQVNKSLVGNRPLNIMHDMPIHDDFEIARDLVRDERSIIFQQAANRLHAQKGLLWWLFKENGLMSGS